MELDKIYCGDCLEIMKDWPNGFIDCCVTSPPYWGLRDYGIDGQLGLEKTPEEYLTKMVAVFREVRRVLKKTGTLWLNMGDSYYGSWGGSGSRDGGQRPKHTECLGRPGVNVSRPGASYTHDTLKPKDLCMMPHRLAMALQKDGWWIRSDIVWAKPNPMPESVTGRPTKAHEYIFLCTKAPKYYYDADAIREEHKYPDDNNRPQGNVQARGTTMAACNSPGNMRVLNPAGRNKRSVWTVPTAPYPEAHFATFPPKLIEPCILAGCPEWVCKKCGKARERIVDIEKSSDSTYASRGKTRPQVGTEEKTAYNSGFNADSKRTSTGWTDCGCNAGFEGGIVFDPFMGSGTTAVVAYENRRQYLGIELNQEYIDLGRIDKVKEKYGLFEEEGS